LPPADMPEPLFQAVLGFEDMRLFDWRDGLWICATVRELNPKDAASRYLPASTIRGLGRFD